MAGSSLWRVDVASQRGATDAISESVETCASETAFDSEQRIALDLLGLDPDTPTVTGHGYDRDINALFARLLTMDDATVMGILAVVMAETLKPGSAMIEKLGRELDVNMATVWQSDTTLLDLIRDREVMTHILADVAGSDIAEANAKATVKVQREIVHDCLTGSNGRGQVEGWVPRWMQFPPSAYTTRGGVGSVDRSLDLSTSEEQQQDDTQLAAEAEPERQAA